MNNSGYAVTLLEIMEIYYIFMISSFNSHNVVIVHVSTLKYINFPKPSLDFLFSIPYLQVFIHKKLI